MGNATMCREVVLSFVGNPQVAKGLFNGSVTATLRARRFAEAGDVIHARNLALNLVIDSVTPMPVCDAATLHYQALGFHTPASFLNEWRALHPHHPSVSRIAYLYRFHRSDKPRERSL